MFKAVMQMLVPQVTEIKKSVVEFQAFQQKISDEISELKSENLKVKSENIALKNRITQLELQNSDKSLIIKNLKPKLGRNGLENPLSLRNDFNGILNTMEIDIYLDNIFRFQKKEGNSTSGDCPLVKISFVSILDKNLFLANLGKLNNSPFRNISVVPDMPKALLPAFKKLDSFAYNWRRENDGRTGVRVKNNGLVLMGRLRHETNFKPIKESH